MAKYTVADIIGRYQDLKNERTNFEPEWQELADMFQPGIQNFNKVSNKPWTDASKTIDGNGKYLVQKLVAHLFGQLTNPSTKWFEFRPEEMEVVVTPQMQRELDVINKRVLNIFNSNRSNFSAEAQSLYSSMVVFGCGILYVENKLGNDIVFKSIPLSQVYISEDFKGNVDTVFRSFKYTAKQLVQAFGKKALSEKIMKALEKAPETEFEIIHCVYPNLDSKKDSDSYISHYVDVSNQNILETNYLKHFPYKIPRWARHVGEKYGHGQGKLALSVMRSMTHIRLENHKALAFSNNPVVLVSDDGVLLPNEIRPGTIIEGALSSLDGQRRLETWSPAGNPSAGIQLYELERDLLNKIFFADDIAMPIDKTRRTATEASLINQDRVRFMAPFISRIESDFLAPLVDLVLVLLAENGVMEDISNETKGLELKAEFLSPLARLLKMEDSRAEQQFLQASLPLIQFKPQLAEMINFEEIIYDTMIGAGAPSKILKTPEEYAQQVQQKEQQAQQQMQMQNALAASQISKNVGLPIE